MTPRRLRTLLLTLTAITLLATSAFLALPAAAAPAGQTDRPMVVVESYYTDKDTITPGQDFNLYLTLKNASPTMDAYSIIINFASGDLIPSGTGGIVTLATGLGPGQSSTLKQPMIVSPSANGGTVGNITANLTYSDKNNTSYTAAFNVALHLTWPSYAPPAPTQTPTPLTVMRPQLTITGYSVDVDPLQPGLPFNLTLNVQNLGNADAKNVTMIMGGGSGSAGGVSGTPEPGGISGASGEFTNFAPLKSSNIHFIGDVAKGQNLSVPQSLIVNTSTNPGAYSVKFSFAYVDGHGVRFVDDQVITLLVFQLPLVEVTFYREPGPFYPGQPGPLPIQITNLARKSVILGNMKATVASGGQVMNNTTLVGAMDPGGYFTLDASLIPEKSGPVDVDISVSYTDDFNQPQMIRQTLQVTVQEQMIAPETMLTPGVPGGKPGEYITPGEMGGVTAPETFWQKVLRFAKGLIGLGSGQPQAQPGGVTIPTEALPGEKMPQPIIVPGPAMKGG